MGEGNHPGRSDTRDGGGGDEGLFAQGTQGVH